MKPNGFSGTTAPRPPRRIARPSPTAAAGIGLAVIALLTALAALSGESFPRVYFPLVGLVAAIAIVRPFIGLAAALVISPTLGWVVMGPDVSAFQLLLAGTAIGTALACRRDGSMLAVRLVRQPEIALVLAFLVALCVAAAVQAANGHLSYVRNYVGAVVLLVVVAVLLRSARRRTILLAVVVAACAASAVVGLLQLFTSDALLSAWVLPPLRVVQDTYVRLAAPWGFGAVASNFAKDVLVGLVLALPFLVRGRRTTTRTATRGLLGAAVIVLSLALFMSGGRSAWLAGVFALGYLAVVMRKHRVFLVGALAMIALLLVCLARPLTPVDVQGAIGLQRATEATVSSDDSKGAADRNNAKPVGEDNNSKPAADAHESKSVADGNDSKPPGDPNVPRVPASASVSGERNAASTEVSDNLRKRLTKAGLEMVRDHPIVGIGPGAFRDYVDAYEPVRPDEPIDARPNLPAHNVFLELWASSGTPAFLLYLAFLISVLLGLERQRRDSDGIDRTTAMGLTAAVIGISVTSLFHNYQTENLLWALIGIAVSLRMWPASHALLAQRLPGGEAPRQTVPTVVSS